MADLATLLIRTIARAFYGVEHILVIDALIVHSTLSDSDLAMIMGMQNKALRKICGRLKEDGIVSVQQRQERRTDGSGGFFAGTATQPGKERLTNKDWYYLNYHRAIDSIKYRLMRLSQHVASLGAPITEKKDLICAQCGNSYTQLEALDNIDSLTGDFICKRCHAILQEVNEEDRNNENEAVKRFNNQIEKIQTLMMQIDAATVPENDFETALTKHKPAPRTDANPASRTEIVDNPNRNIGSTKGLAIQPEKVSVQVQDDETVKKEAAEAEAQARREKEARQNALPEWISKSTVSGDITAVGAKEERQRREREAHLGPSGSAPVNEDGEEKKVDKGDEDVMNSYWAELARQQETAAANAKEEDDDDDDDDEEEDEFEDVDVSGTGANTPAVNGSGIRTNVSTPQVESSNATDDEREAKRPKLAGDAPTSAANPVMSGAIGSAAAENKDTPAASDEDDDDLEFENV